MVVGHIVVTITAVQYRSCPGIESPLHFHALQRVGCCAGCNAGGLGQVEHAEPGHIVTAQFNLNLLNSSWSDYIITLLPTILPLCTAPYCHCVPHHKLLRHFLAT